MRGLTRQPQGLHDQIVLTMVSAYRARGFVNIRADLPAHSKPEVTYWNGRSYRPDIRCLTAIGGTAIACEVETEDSIGTRHTGEQWIAFYTEAVRVDGEFHIAVPLGLRPAVEQQLAVLGIPVDNVRIIEV